MEVGSATSASAADTKTAYGAALGTMGKEDFLTLLVAQLNNQDPLNPQDSAEFVSQLTQFSALEQLISIKQAAEEMASILSQLGEVPTQGSDDDTGVDGSSSDTSETEQTSN